MNNRAYIHLLTEGAELEDLYSRLTPKTWDNLDEAVNMWLEDGLSFEAMVDPYLFVVLFQTGNTVTEVGLYRELSEVLSEVEKWYADSL